MLLADNQVRLDWLKMAHARGRYLGVETEIISVKEAKELIPLLDESHFVGAMWDPIEGHLDPYGTTHAYAKSARMTGAEIVLQNRVTELRRIATARGTSSPSRARCAPSMSSTPAACGRAKSAAWSGSSCRCCAWSTTTS